MISKSYQARTKSRAELVGAMDVIALDIPDVRILKPKKHSDHRGFFSGVYNKRAIAVKIGT